MTPAEARRVLGVEPGPSPAEVDGAFRRRAWELHPDRGGDQVEFASLVEAHRVLARIAGANRGRSVPGARPAPAVSVEPDAAMRRRVVGATVRRWAGRRRTRDLE